MEDSVHISYNKICLSLDPSPPHSIKVTPSAFDRNSVIVSWLKPILPISMSTPNSGSLEQHKKVNSIKSYILYKR